MNKKSLLAVFAATMLTVFVGGCGTTRTLQFIEASATPLSQGVTVAQTRNLVGIGGSEEIFVIANFSGGHEFTDVTSEATFVSSNPSVVSVGPGGRVQVLAGYCDWTLVPNPTPGASPPEVPAIIPNLIITVTASFQGMTTQVNVNVNSLASCPGPTTQS